jgi:hypothetical protein
MHSSDGDSARKAQDPNPFDVFGPSPYDATNPFMPEPFQISTYDEAVAADRQLRRLGLEVVPLTLPRRRRGRLETRPDFYRDLRDAASATIIKNPRVSLKAVAETLNRKQFPEMKTETLKRYIRWAWIDAKHLGWKDFKRAVLRAHQENLAREKVGTPSN